MELFDEKNRGRISFNTVPLSFPLKPFSHAACARLGTGQETTKGGIPLAIR
jgi:hypothetical protein